METHVTAKQDTKAALIQAGMELMLKKGYSNTGIQEVLSVSGIPKGSFYHHFTSKEQFAVEIIHYFDYCYSADIERTLLNMTRGPIDRLRDYYESSKAMLAAQGCSKGCLIGNLSQEMSDQSEVLRKELCIVMNKWRHMLAACIEEGQRAGKIRSKHSAHELAELLSASWSGAVMRAKTVKNTESLDVFVDVIFNTILT